MATAVTLHPLVYKKPNVILFFQVADNTYPLFSLLFGWLFVVVVCVALHLRFSKSSRKFAHYLMRSIEATGFGPQQQKKHSHKRTHWEQKVQTRFRHIRHCMPRFVLLLFILSFDWYFRSAFTPKKKMLCARCLSNFSWLAVAHTYTIHTRAHNYTHWHRCEIPSKQKEVKARSALSRLHWQINELRLLFGDDVAHRNFIFYCYYLRAAVATAAAPAAASSTPSHTRCKGNGW